MSRNIDSARSVEWTNLVRASTSTTGLPFPVERMTRELCPELGELARKARCLGPPGQGAIVLLTGGARRSGVSGVARALAHVAAAECSVLLVHVEAAAADGDLEAAPRDFGTLEERIYSAGPTSPLSILPINRAVADALGPLSGNVVRAGFARLRARYELIVVDGRPVFDGGSSWAALADATLLVCDPRRSPQAEWSKAWDRLEESGTHIMGIVESATTFPSYQA